MGVGYALVSVREKQDRMELIYVVWESEIVHPAWLQVTWIPSSELIGLRSVRGNLAFSLPL